MPKNFQVEMLRVLINVLNYLEGGGIICWEWGMWRWGCGLREGGEMWQIHWGTSQADWDFCLATDTSPGAEIQMRKTSGHEIISF